MSCPHTTLPSLDQTLDHLRQVEKRYDQGVRLEQTRRAIEANDRFCSDRRTIDAYLAHLGSKDMFIPIYGLGNTPNGLPVALPRYLVEILDASARVLFALSRRDAKAAGPQYLLDRMPAGWLSAEMAEKLYHYYLTTEPDLAFDVLVYGQHSRRGMSFEEFKKSGDVLHAKLLEAQSVDTYWGWAREFIRGARLAGCGADCQFTLALDAEGRPLSDEALDRQVLDTYLHGCAEPEGLLFLEIEPEKQATHQNLRFLADAMSAGPGHRPAILDPRDLEIRGGQLFIRKAGQQRPVKKVVSRIVDADLQAFIKARTTEGDRASIELFQRIYAVGDAFPDLSKHLAGFYLIDKSSLTQMSLLGEISVAPRTEIITPDHLARYRRDPALLKGIAIKPLHGMSAKGVYVRPTLQQVEEATAHEKMLAQEIIWATPIQPCVTPDLNDADVQAGICTESRLVLHAGTPAAPASPHRARTIAGLSRSHFQSADPDRKIKNDPKGRGWYSNMGAILAVKAELGITGRDDAGIGMSPIYWTI